MSGPPASVARVRLRELLHLCALLTQRVPGFHPGPVIIEMMQELRQAELSAVSEVGNASTGSGKVERVIEWTAPDEAGELVGVGGRRVRQLAASGAVRAKQSATGRWLVDAADLQRYMHEQSA